MPTIAAEGRNRRRGRRLYERLALDAGFQQARIVKTDGVPGVFATLDAGAKDTLAVYFMYDVKQYDPAEWTSPPLEARIVDRPGEGKAIVGRGAVNQKGPETAFLAALHAFRAAGVKLPVNLVLVAEGEEEIASPNFHQIIAEPEVQRGARAVGRDHHSIGVARVQGRRDTSMLGAKGAVELQLIASGEKWGAGRSMDIHSSLMARVESPAWHLVQALEHAGRRGRPYARRSTAGSTM